MKQISTNLKKRIASTLIAILPLVYIILQGGMLFYLFLSVIGVFISWEWFNITLKREFHFQFIILAISSLVINYLTYINDSAVNIIIIIACILSLRITTKDKKIKKWHTIGSIYILLSVYFIARARYSFGSEFFFIMILTTWMIDIGAYVIGKNFGKRKLLPSISPNKTYGGLLGAMIFSTIFLTIIKYSLPDIFGDIGLVGFILLAVISSLVGQAGDLFGSYIKRKFNVKDSSNLILGYGGILDRIGGLIFITILWTMLS